MASKLEVLSPFVRADAKRIGFLFNHDQIHQVAHSLPIALALSQLDGNFEIVIAVTSSALRNEVIRMAGPALARMTLIDLQLRSRVSHVLAASLGSVVPANKVLVYRDNLEFFRSLDLLVVSERTSLILKSRYGLEKPLMVLADHGAGDRAIAFGQNMAMFDHILAAGTKLRDRFMTDAGVAGDRVTITGYPKFDVVGDSAPRLPMQDNGRPTVLYNPHVSPHLSSWYTMGTQILDYFLENPRYNLICAPHVMLFQRRVAVSVDKLRFARTGSVARKYRDAPNIHFDPGSLASTDMTYVRAADIYLGDCSSQIYEFLQKPRPCVFVNAQGYAWQGDPNFAHWQAGPVIETIHELERALDHATSYHNRDYKPVQRRMFDHTFHLTDETSSARAARVVLQLADAATESRSIALA
jgi:hypothetical protein